MDIRHNILALAAGAALIFSGCDAPTDPAADDDTTATVATASLSFVVGDNSLARSMGAHVTVTSAKILLRTIQFHSVDDSDSLDFESGATVIVLDLAGGITTIGPIEIPAGSYDKISFRLHKPDSSDSGIDTDFYESDSGSNRYSVVASLTMGDTSFTFKSRRTAKQRLEFDPPLVITDTTGTVNVTLSVDVNSWFIDANDGTDLDPTDEADESEIDNAIKESFRGFRDDDKSGD